MQGSSSATVTLIEFGEFQDPFGGRFWADTLPLIRQNFIDTGKINYVFRDFPLSSIHPEAQPAAEASECADEQGMYWPYHDTLFANQSSLGTDNYKLWAQLLGLDSTQFNSCFDSGKYRTEVQNDFADGSEAGVGGTPWFFIQNVCGSEVTLVGAQPYTAFEQALSQSLSESQNCTGFADLAITDIMLTPESPRLNETVIISSTITNLGDVPTNASFCGYEISHEEESREENEGDVGGPVYGGDSSDPVCGNGICERDLGENDTSCPVDCFSLPGGGGGGGGGGGPACNTFPLDPTETAIVSSTFVPDSEGVWTISASVSSSVPDSNPDNNVLSISFTIPSETTSLEERVADLEHRVTELESRVGILEATVALIQETLDALENTINEILGYLTNTPKSARQHMICGYMRDNNISTHFALGLECQLRNTSCACVPV